MITSNIARRIVSGSTLPTATVGRAFIKTGADEGLHICSSVGVWTGPISGGGAAAWGTITGTLADQTDLQTALNAKLNLAGGTLTGHLLFTDNTLDIGASGATRPRTGYFGTSVVSPLFTGALNGTVGATTPAAGAFTAVAVQPTSGNTLALTAGSVATASTFKAGDKGFGGGGQIQLLDGATPTVEETATNGINLGSALRIFWSSAAGVVGADDAGFSRVGVNTIGVGTGAAGSTAGHLSLTNLAASGTITQTSASAAAFESGPNGGTNPVLRVVNSTASQADGVSITGLAAGSGTNITALSSGSNAGITLIPKGSAGVIIRGISNTVDSFQVNRGNVGRVEVHVLTDQPATNKYALDGATWDWSSDWIGRWRAATDWFTGSADTSLSRQGAGVLQIGDGGANANGTLKATRVDLNAPVTKTGDFTWGVAENWIIVNQAGTTTATLPAAASFNGRILHVKTIQAQAVVSASSNVVPLVGGAAGTAILPATAGQWATLVSDGTNWIIMESNG